MSNEQDFERQKLRFMRIQAAVAQQYFANHEVVANEINDRLWNKETIFLLSLIDEMSKALRTIIYASDKCQGHRNCDHDMAGWAVARAVLHKIESDGAP
jgi:hypothetical protein